MIRLPDVAFVLIPQKILNGPGQQVFKPGIGISKRRLTSFHSHLSGNNWNPEPVRKYLLPVFLSFRLGSNQHIAGGSAHDFA